MSYGFQAFNDANTVSIDENSVAYVYLGKWAIDVNENVETDIAITCAGYPLVFFGVPYGTVNGGENSAGIGHTFLALRAGIQMTRLRQVSGSNWIVTVRCNFVNGGDPGPLYVRVFGELHQNFPTGSGDNVGLMVWDDQARLVFDSNLRMLRLAGDTYDTEIVMPPDVPDDTARVDQKDTSVTVPFNMANKSICANVRGYIHYPYYTGSYVDFDTGQLIDQYDVMNITTMYWSNGSTLYARRVAPTSSRSEQVGIYIIDTSNANTVYSRLAVIDNTKYP